MIRPFLILALAIYFTSNSLSAPKLIDKTPIPIYLPSTEGAKLVYTSHSRDGTSTQTDLVKTVEQKDRSLIVTIERSNNKDETKNTLQFLMNEEGLFRLKADGSKTHCKVRLPFKADESWDFTVDDLVKYSYTARKKEKLKVAAGTFDAVCVETVPPRVTREYYLIRTWYSEGIGIVREERVVDGIVTETKELSSLTKSK